MNAFSRPICVLILLLVPAFAPAQRPAPEVTRGKVLLLDNDRILEGDIEKVNGQFRIRRSIGELWIPADRSKRLCKDVDDAFEIMKKQANLKDPDERVRLARWCQMNGLKTHALNEAKIALDMRPEHAESLNLVQMLQRIAISSSPGMATQHPPPPSVPHLTQPAAKPQIAARAALDVSSESFAIFATRVQPILMNTCITCHSNGKGGGFQLVRANDGGARTAAQANLNAVLDFVNLERPVLSSLLIKSVVAHGGATAAPLKGRQSIPFQSLQGWVDQLMAGNPHLKEIRQAETQGGTSMSAKKDYFGEAFAAPDRIAAPPPLPLQMPQIDPKKPGDIVSRPLPRFDGKASPLPTNPPIAAPPPAAVAPVGPRDPFDPTEFNSRPKQ